MIYNNVQHKYKFIDNVARVIHKHHRAEIFTTKSKIATYTLAVYKLREYIALNDIEITDNELNSYLNKAVNEADTLTKYLFEIDMYDKPFEELTEEIKSEYYDIVKGIYFFTD